MKKLLAGFLFLGVLAVTTFTLFGDNFRKLFGASSSSLAGDATASRQHASQSMQKRNLMFFGDATTGYDAVAAAPVRDNNRFNTLAPNGFVEAREDALSTFALDVDTASYSVARRYLQMHQRPPPSSIRVEEWVNAFDDVYPQPEEGALAVYLDGVRSPFDERRHLVRVGFKAKDVDAHTRAPMNLVFLVDTSCSMEGADRLTLAKRAMGMIVRRLDARDTVSIVTYAGGVSEVLPPTRGDDRDDLLAAIDRLDTRGGTAMASGMELAYRNAARGVKPGVVSRVLVFSDGDANIGATGPDEILSAVKGYVEEGVTLSTFGFGMGNYRDDMMERLADAGNGNASYIDDARRAAALFEKRFFSLMQVAAKDVKVQVAFDPRAVRRYRLVGYENRDVKDEEFRDDRADGGEVGAGHAVTAVYEVELTGERAELAKVFVRAKHPDGHQAFEKVFSLSQEALHRSIEVAPLDLRFHVAVAAAADILRGAPAAKDWSLAKAASLARSATDGRPDREEFARLMGLAQALITPPAAQAAAYLDGY